MTARRAARGLGVVGLFALLTVAATWPQARYLATQATPHQDVYFNMWRLSWVAHAISTDPARLFDANIFHPEPQTLAYSDAMIVEGLVAAPLLWSGVKPVLVHNLLLLGALAGSGAAMFALARYLTGSRGAGVMAGIVFAFAPYRFEHVMHMELQWAMWTPLAFLALHRTLDTGRWKYGLATGACIALQMLSSIYYGIFLATLIGAGALLFLASDRHVPLARALLPLAAAAVLAAALSAAYAIPYLQVQQRVGERAADEVATFSAKPMDYLVATPSNLLYGRVFSSRARPERRLFPGAIPVLLAIAGLLLRPASRRAISYLVLLAVAFETSLGSHGYLYPLLYDYVPGYRGLRAAARLGIFTLLFLGVLAAYGYTALAWGRSLRIRAALLATLAAGLLVEYRTTPALAPFPNIAPPVYRILSKQPRGVVAEFPVPRLDALPGDEAQYGYMSTFHWFPLVNGYSGTYPASYLERLERLADFPSDRSLHQLRQDGARYVIVHGSSYPGVAFDELRMRIGLTGAFDEIGAFDDFEGHAVLYLMRP